MEPSWAVLNAAEEWWCSKIMHWLARWATATGNTLQWCGVVFQYHDHYTVVNTEKYQLTEAMVGNYCILLQWYEPSKFIPWLLPYISQNCCHLLQHNTLPSNTFVTCSWKLSNSNGVRNPKDPRWNAMTGGTDCCGTDISVVSTFILLLDNYCSN